jgi:2-polyprenyl-3-methyl-5-hydroxy-6-metoxy-1,4-benzoquinol methylase
VAQLPEAGAEEDYDIYYQPEYLTVPDFAQRRLNEIARRFAPYRQHNRLLDVGCGNGGMLLAARESGWQAQGLEVSTPAVEHVRKLGFEVRQGFLQDARFPDAHFDVITVIEVLEHVPDLPAFVAELSRLLRPGGYLFATTPHGRGISWRLLGTRWSVVSPPEHLQLLSVAGTRDLLRRNGFGRTKILTQSVNPREIVHVLRSKGEPKAETEGFDRGETSRELNAALSGNPAGRLFKGAVNGVLQGARMGDSLKIGAVRQPSI